MNKHCYRVIFSKTQQQFIVVSEIAKTAGQAKSEGKIRAEAESMKTLAKLTALFHPFLNLYLNLYLLHYCVLGDW